MYKNNREIEFDDVYLKPNKTIVDSRDNCDCSMLLNGFRFKTPIIPANMKSVVSDDLCELLAENGWFYINHRFNVDNVKFIDRMKSKNLVSSISVGVNKDSYSDLVRIKKAGLQPDFITLDIANAYSNKGECMVKYIKDIFNSFLIVGNCCTQEAVVDIEEWGANAVKVGISNGFACDTYKATGFGRPQFSTVLECATVANTMIISDGGCKCVGDMVKAVTAGASMVMAGNMFSGFDESPGDFVAYSDKDTGEMYYTKEYYGSASIRNKDVGDYIEGKIINIPCKGSIIPYLKTVQDGIKSAISYSGGRTLSSLSFGNVKYFLK